MNEIKATSKLVKKTLISHPDARNSDNYLYYVICKGQLEKQGLDINKISFSKALLNRKIYKLPPFETCRRSRQKIQKECPELAGTDEVEEVRSYNEEIVREFSKGAAI